MPGEQALLALVAIGCTGLALRYWWRLVLAFAPRVRGVPIPVGVLLTLLAAAIDSYYVWEDSPWEFWPGVVAAMGGAALTGALLPELARGFMGTAWSLTKKGSKRAAGWLVIPTGICAVLWVLTSASVNLLITVAVLTFGLSLVLRGLWGGKK